MKSNDKLNKACNRNVRILRFIKIRLKKRYNHKQNYIILNQILRGGVAHWVARLARNVEVVGSSPIKCPRCFLQQEILPLLLSTGWFQERIRA